MHTYITKDIGSLYNQALSLKPEAKGDKLFSVQSGEHNYTVNLANNVVTCDCKRSKVLVPGDVGCGCKHSLSSVIAYGNDQGYYIEPVPAYYKSHNPTGLMGSPYEGVYYKVLGHGVGVLMYPLPSFFKVNQLTGDYEVLDHDQFDLWVNEHKHEYLWLYEYLGLSTMDEPVKYYLYQLDFYDDQAHDVFFENIPYQLNACLFAEPDSTNRYSFIGTGVTPGILAYTYELDNDIIISRKPAVGLKRMGHEWVHREQKNKPPVPDMKEFLEYFSLLRPSFDTVGTYNSISVGGGYLPKPNRLPSRSTRIFNAVTEYFHEALKNNKDMLKYLYGRGLTDEVICKYKLGYADDSYGSLRQFLKDNNFDQTLAYELGLLRSGTGFYDAWRNRLMFPLIEGGNTVAYAGRGFNGNTAKYLNSSSDVYQKSSFLYGYDFAYEEAMQKGFMCLVEGYTDVISAQENGFINTVAVSGTSFTKQNVAKLKNLRELVLVFDGDEAGFKATVHNIKSYYNCGIDNLPVLSVAVLPFGSDPDTLIRKDVDLYAMALLNRVSAAVWLAQNASGSTKDVADIVGLISGYLVNQRQTHSFENISRELSYYLSLRPKTIMTCLVNGSC